MVVEAETKRHTVDVEEVHTVKAPCRRVHSPMEDFYSPSWTCMGSDFSPDCTALHVGVPFAHNSNPLGHGFLQQKQKKNFLFSFTVN